MSEYDIHCLFTLSPSVLNLSFLQFLLFNRVAAVAVTKEREESTERPKNVSRESE
jgi:hypothetical protein